MPGFGDLLRRVSEYFRGHGAEIGRQNAQLALALDRLAPAKAAAARKLDRTPLLRHDGPWRASSIRATGDSAGA